MTKIKNNFLNLPVLHEATLSSKKDLRYTRWGVASLLLVTCLAKCAGRGCRRNVSRDVFTNPV